MARIGAGGGWQEEGGATAKLPPQPFFCPFLLNREPCARVCVCSAFQEEWAGESIALKQSLQHRAT